MRAKVAILCMWLSSACAGGALSNTDDTTMRECHVPSQCAAGGDDSFTVPVLIIAAMIGIPAVIHHQFRSSRN